MKKRFLAVVLAALMLVSVFPIGVFADEAATFKCPGEGEEHTLDNCDCVLRSTTTETTCTETKTTFEYVCYGCLATFTVEQSEEGGKGHDWYIVDETLVPPTCTENGSVKYACKNCEATKEVEVRPDNIHENVTRVKGKVPTCTAEGWYAYWRCDDCGKFYAKYDKATKKAGIELNADAPEKDELIARPMKDHKLEEVKAVPHTYDPKTYEETAGTYAYYKCTVCGKMFWNGDNDYSDEITDEADLVELDHDYKVVDENPQHYTVHYEIDGIVYHLVQCTICGKYEVRKCDCPEEPEPEPQPEVCEHEATFVEAKASTCIEKGNDAYYHCDKCEKNFSDAECTTELETVELDYGAHTLVHHEAVAHTKFAAGTIEYWECSVCGKLFEDAEGEKEITDVSEWEHEWDSYDHITVYNPKTKETVKYHEYTCLICGDTKTEICDCKDDCKCEYTDDEITAIIDGRSYVYYLAPTCTKEGELDWICDKCGKPAHRDLDALGHKLDDNDDVTDCTVDLKKCINEGCTYVEGDKHTFVPNETVTDCEEDYSVCSVCGATKGNDEGHAQPADGVEITGNLCIGQTTKYKCDVCGKDVEETDQDEGHLPWNKGETNDLLEEQTPTCTEAGWYVYKCEQCGDPVRMDVGAKGHKWDKGVEHAATCYSDAYKVYTCQNENRGVACGCTYTVYVEGTKLKNESKYGEGTFWAKDDAEAVHGEGTVCNENRVGYNCAGTTYLCPNCGEYFTLIGPSYVAYPHTWGELIEEVAPTCVATGMAAHYVCDVCGKYADADKNVAEKEDLIIAIDENAHKWGDLVDEVPATCTEDGKKAYRKCELCGKFLYTKDGEKVVTDEEKDLIIEKLDHSIAEIADSRVESCTKFGYTHWVCPCGAEWIDDYAKELGHILFLDNAHSYEPTCGEDGANYYICARNSECGVVYTEVIPATGDHTPVIIKGFAPTCENPGATSSTICGVCKEVLEAYEEIPATGHTEEVIPGKAATCTETGLTDGLKCSVCEKILKEQEEIPATGHTPVIIKGFAADCRHTGLTDSKICSVCEVVIEEPVVIPMTDHTPGEWTLVKAPTATEAGEEAKFCTVCGEKLESRELTATMKATFKVYNANAPEGFENTYADSSLIAVDVTIGTLEYVESIGVWCIALNVNYDNGALDYVKCIAKSELLTDNLQVTDRDGYVRIMVSAKDSIDFKNADIAGDEVIVTLYFRVNNKTAASAEFTYSNIQILDADKNEIEITTENDSIAISTLLDPTDDGNVDLYDVYYACSIITEAIDVTYDVTIDLNKDGKIDLYDLDMLCKFVAEAVSYQDVYDFGN